MNLPISNPTIRVIVLVCLLSLAVLNPGSRGHESGIAAPHALDVDFISVPAGNVADASFDDYRDVSTQNRVEGGTRTLEELGITQACQLKLTFGSIFGDCRNTRPTPDTP